MRERFPPVRIRVNVTDCWFYCRPGRARQAAIATNLSVNRGLSIEFSRLLHSCHPFCRIRTILWQVADLPDSCDPKGSVQQCGRVLDFMAARALARPPFFVPRAVTGIVGHGARLALLAPFA